MCEKVSYLIPFPLLFHVCVNWEVWWFPECSKNHTTYQFRADYSNFATRKKFYPPAKIIKIITHQSTWGPERPFSCLDWLNRQIVNVTLSMYLPGQREARLKFLWCIGGNKLKTEYRNKTLWWTTSSWKWQLNDVIRN